MTLYSKIKEKIDENREFLDRVKHLKRIEIGGSSLDKVACEIGKEYILGINKGECEFRERGEYPSDIDFLLYFDCDNEGYIKKSIKKILNRIPIISGYKVDIPYAVGMNIHCGWSGNGIGCGKYLCECPPEIEFDSHLDKEFDKIARKKHYRGEYRIQNVPCQSPCEEIITEQELELFKESIIYERDESGGL